jgi:hypothetical protein
MKTIELPAHLNQNFRLKLDGRAEPEEQAVFVRLIVLLPEKFSSIDVVSDDAHFVAIISPKRQTRITMSYANISASIVAADLTAIRTSLDAINAKLPFLITLTTEERKKLFKMGDKSVAFVQQCLQAVKDNPTLMPAGFSVTEFDKDVKLATDLLTVLTQVRQLAEKLDDTLMAVASEAMNESSQVYGQVKLAAKRSPGMKTLAEQLGERYKSISQGRAKKPNATI